MREHCYRSVTNLLGSIMAESSLHLAQPRTKHGKTLQAIDRPDRLEPGHQLEHPRRPGPHLRLAQLASRSSQRGGSDVESRRGPTSEGRPPSRRSSRAFSSAPQHASIRDHHPLRSTPRSVTMAPEKDGYVSSNSRSGSVAAHDIVGREDVDSASGPASEVLR